MHFTCGWKKSSGNILCVHTAFQCVPIPLNLRLRERQRVSRGYKQLPLYKILQGTHLRPLRQYLSCAIHTSHVYSFGKASHTDQPRDHLRDRMFDLQTRVHFAEIELPTLGVKQEFDRASSTIAAVVCICLIKHRMNIEVCSQRTLLPSPL
jgi:hypothetical protein